MKIFDQAKVRQTHMRHVNTLARAAANMELAPTGDTRPYTTDANEEWVLSITVAQSFWANRVQLPYVRKSAERALAALLYRDVLAELDHLSLCISSGDAEGALEAVGRIREATQP